MSQWQCSNCKKTYTFTQYMGLSAVYANPDEPEKYGNVPVCTCGKRFHLDKWRL